MNLQWQTPAGRDQIFGLTHSAVNRPWPGRNGARDFRVLVGVLQQAALGKCGLEAVVPLEQFAAQIGLVKHEGVRDSFLDLGADGWLTFELGTQDTFGAQHEKGTPSKATLLSRPSTGELNPLSLPSPSHRIFREHDGAIGTAGYLTVCKLWQMCRDDRIVVTARELTETTGLSRDRIYGLRQKLVDLFHGEIDGSSLIFEAEEILRVLDIDSSYDTFLQMKKREQANSRKRGPNSKLFITFPHPITGELIKIRHVGYLERGIPQWSENQGYDDRLKNGNDRGRAKPLSHLDLPDLKNTDPIEVRLQRFWDREGRKENPNMTFDELAEALETEDEWEAIDSIDLTE